jgi:hypothetical protein
MLPILAADSCPCCRSSSKRFCFEIVNQHGVIERFQAGSSVEMRRWLGVVCN